MTCKLLKPEMCPSQKKLREKRKREAERGKRDGQGAEEKKREDRRGKEEDTRERERDTTGLWLPSPEDAVVRGACFKIMIKA